MNCSYSSESSSSLVADSVATSSSCEHHVIEEIEEDR
jgi:hypothetical protein